MSDRDSSVRLNDGHAIPLIGLGTWDLRGEPGRAAIRRALELGYRHIDTATGYHNERHVGAALRDSGLARAEVFVTTKCPPEDADRPREVLSASLEQLGTDYVDLWLIHWPPDGGPRADMWEAFIEARREGLARSIGVSNYSTAQIDALVEATGVTPALDQIPWAPSLYDPARAGELDERDVVLEGYSPLKRSSLADPVVVEIARAHGATAAQVVLRWHIEHGVVAIPKSASPERQAENLAAYDLSLSAEEVERLDGLGRRQR